MPSSLMRWRNVASRLCTIVPPVQRRTVEKWPSVLTAIAVAVVNSEYTTL